MSPLAITTASAILSRGPILRGVLTPAKVSTTAIESTPLMCGEHRLHKPALSEIRRSNPARTPQSKQSEMLLMKKWSGQRFPEIPTCTGRPACRNRWSSDVVRASNFTTPIFRPMGNRWSTILRMALVFPADGGPAKVTSFMLAFPDERHRARGPRSSRASSGP